VTAATGFTPNEKLIEGVEDAEGAATAVVASLEG